MDDVLFLSRLQFAITIMFHYLFPPLTIGLGGLMVIMEWKWLRTGDALYGRMARFWTKIFAVNFALGVATGIVMEFQFGTNWATYSRYVGDVFGSALAAEGIFAFFLESGFLAVLVFGWDRVGPKMHFFAALMVAMGATFSAIWIVIANSWQQTPAGFHLVTEAGRTRAEITDFWQLVFNPSSVIRLVHVLIGCWILACFVVMSISAWYLLKRRHEEFAKRSFRIALVVGTVFVFAAPFTGHIHADVVARYQPAKLAAYEGHFRQTGEGAPMSLIGWPDEEEQTTTGIEVPGLLSFLLHGDPDEPVTALDEIHPDQRPPVLLPFMSYHLMVGLGTSFMALCTLGLLWWWRGKLFESRWLLWIFVIAAIGPYIANQAGWVAAEVGRQPYVVYPVYERDADGEIVKGEDGFLKIDPDKPGLRTADGLSKSVHAGQTLASIIMFGMIYALLFAVWVFVMNDKIQHGPEEPGTDTEDSGDGDPGGGDPPRTDTGFIRAAAFRPGGSGMTGTGSAKPDTDSSKED